MGLAFAVAFAMFAFSTWRIDLDFLSNLRYASLIEIGKYEYSCESAYINDDCTRIPLAQCLILPILIAVLGGALRSGLISQEIFGRHRSEPASE